VRLNCLPTDAIKRERRERGGIERGRMREAKKVGRREIGGTHREMRKATAI
jgi:hypothetical protein